MITDNCEEFLEKIRRSWQWYYSTLVFCLHLFVSCISWAVPKNILIQRKYQKTYWIFCICTFTPCVASNKDVFKHKFLDLQPHLRNLQQYWPLLGIYNTQNFVNFYD